MSRFISVVGFAAVALAIYSGVEAARIGPDWLFPLPNHMPPHTATAFRHDTYFTLHVGPYSLTVEHRWQLIAMYAVVGGAAGAIAGVAIASVDQLALLAYGRFFRHDS